MTNQIPVRDCQTQADLELAENAMNHQRDPETSLSSDEIQRECDAPKEDEALLNGTDKSQDRHEEHKPRNGVDAKSASPPLKGESGVDLGGDVGGDPEGNPNAKIKKVAKYAIGFTAAAAAIGVGAFVAAPVVLTGLGFGAAGIASGSIGASMMSASAIANGGGVAAGSLVAVLQSAGATGGFAAATCAGVGIGGAAVGTALVAAGEVTVGAVRYINRQKNRNLTMDAETQTDPDDDAKE